MEKKINVNIGLFCQKMKDCPLNPSNNLNQNPAANKRVFDCTCTIENRKGYRKESMKNTFLCCVNGYKRDQDIPGINANQLQRLNINDLETCVDQT